MDHGIYLLVDKVKYLLIQSLFNESFLSRMTLKLHSKYPNVEKDHKKASLDKRSFFDFACEKQKAIHVISQQAIVRNWFAMF